jgi:tetratricopeptide (TPR) repeat protein
MLRPHFTKGRSDRNLIVLLCFGFALAAHACIWDSDTLKDEIKKNPTLAEAILNPKPPQVDKAAITAKLNELLEVRKEDDPDWWNNVAGAYLRMGQADEAAKLLEPVVSRFEDNYGIHANLGTAYHLLGRYVEAEKHIARDLELNPEAHFGLEKYHLALLQYLAKPKEYQARHVYVDEYTAPLLDLPDVNQPEPYALIHIRDTNQSPAALSAAYQAISGTNRTNQEAKAGLLLKLAAWDERPAYASEPKPRYISATAYDVKNQASTDQPKGKHELAEDEKFQEGVIYMATLNPDEPACWTMLGMAALRSGDLHLAQTAFEKAITLGSPLKEVLQLKILVIQEHIRESKTVSTKINLAIVMLIATPCVCLGALVVIIRKLRRRWKTKQAIRTLIIICLGMFTTAAHACIWDSDTLFQEKWHSPKLADAILKPQSSKPNREALEKRIAGLEANRKENDPAWWNDLAGAYIRLGHLEKAVDLLESVVSRFENDYGIHANLGTAYHLLGRYEEAEKHIARDLEINPEAHYGLEKYHLALLQYLKESKEYQGRHLYVDEISKKFLHTSFYFGSSISEKLSREEIQDQIKELSENSPTMQSDSHSTCKLLALKSHLDTPPAYTKKWNLGGDQKLEEGVIYMASLNPNEPACWTMLGVVALKKRDLNLAAKAFEKAVAQDSPMKELLEEKISSLNNHIAEAQKDAWPLLLIGLVFLCLFGLLIYKVFMNLKAYLSRYKSMRV